MLQRFFEWWAERIAVATVAGVERAFLRLQADGAAPEAIAERRLARLTAENGTAGPAETKRKGGAR
jgi:hypothetical protein